MAASAAIVPAAGSRVGRAAGSMTGRLGAGSDCGIASIVAKGLGTIPASTVTTMMPTSDPGIDSWIFGATTMQTATIATAPRE